MTERRFHVKAWLCWLGAVMTVVLAIDNPAVTVVALAALVVVTASFAARGPEGRSAAFFLKVGITIVALRVVLYGLTGHTGDTTLVMLPRAALPSWLGGFALGGRVTAEVLAQEIADGLRIAAFLACFGVFFSVVETYRVLRLLPRFLFEAGLVVGIALAFVPILLRSASDVRDAQRLRGHRFRGVRSLPPLVTPVLADALERSLTLAASMESRGYGRSARDHHEAEARARVAVLVGVLGLSTGGGFVLFGRALAGWPLLLAGAVVLAAGLRRLAHAVCRTRFRDERMDAWDRAMSITSAAVALIAFGARASGVAHWDAYPAVRFPALNAPLLALAAAVAFPVVLGAVRASRLRRASEDLPVTHVGVEAHA